MTPGAMAGEGGRRRKAKLKARRAPLVPQRSSAEHLDLVMRAINEGVYDWDVARGTIYYSEAVYTVLQMPRSVTTPGAWHRRIHPDDRGEFDRRILEHFKGRRDRFQCDYRYREYGFNGFAITPGHYHMNGLTALAYARIRHSAGESDFTRAARQQEVLIALRDAIVRGGFINDPIGFIEAIGRTVSTSVPPELVASLAVYATRIRLQDVYRAVITYPLISESSGDGRGWIELPNLPRIRALSAVLFPEVGTLPTLPKTGSGISFGYQPGASATPRPTASGSASPTITPTPVLSYTPTRTPTRTPTPTPSPSRTRVSVAGGIAAKVAEETT